MPCHLCIQHAPFPPKFDTYALEYIHILEPMLGLLGTNAHLFSRLLCKKRLRKKCVLPAEKIHQYRRSRRSLKRDISIKPLAGCGWFHLISLPVVTISDFCLNFVCPENKTDQGAEPQFAIEPSLCDGTMQCTVDGCSVHSISHTCMNEWHSCVMEREGVSAPAQDVPTVVFSPVALLQEVERLTSNCLVFARHLLSSHAFSTWVQEIHFMQVDTSSLLLWRLKILKKRINL